MDRIRIEGAKKKALRSRFPNLERFPTIIDEPRGDPQRISDDMRRKTQAREDQLRKEYTLIKPIEQPNERPIKRRQSKRMWQ